jgi:hypothetical protein
VNCQPLGDGVVKIGAGTDANGAEAVIDDEDGLVVKSLSVNKVNGFTGSYWRDIRGEVQVGLLDGAYVITGEARGFNDTDPSVVTTEKFRIKVVC